MALARARQAARRVKDRWKAKQWYNVIAPTAFNSKPMGETMADEPEKLIGRIVDTTMHELTGDMKQMHVKIAFRINEVVDSQAKTVFIGHEMTSDYIRRLTRRGHTKISAVFDVKTNDGSRIRVKPFAVSDRRCQTTQAQIIRKMMQDMITASAAENSTTGFLKDILVGDLTGRIYKDARKIHPLRRIEVAKTEVLRAPTIEVDETPIIVDAPEPVAAPEVEETEEAEAVDGDEDSEDEVVADESVEAGDSEDEVVADDKADADSEEE